MRGYTRSNLFRMRQFYEAYQGDKKVSPLARLECIADKTCPSRARTQDRAHGKTVVRELWTHALKPGEVDFPEAHLLLCVRQRHLGDDGSQSTEWRYFVTCLSTVHLSFAHLLKLVRLHWAIENPLHWTLDLVLQEDERQPCLANASALQVTTWLRTLAYNLLTAWRALLPLVDGLPVRWQRACEKLRDALVHGSSSSTQGRATTPRSNGVALPQPRPLSACLAPAIPDCRL
jgi:predicted transposase YbfD/YdcC